MSSDYSAYAKTKRRSMRSVRAAATAVVARQGRTLLPVEDERDDDELHFADLGPLTVTVWKFGVQLSVSTTDGGREHFEELGELANAICAELGELLDEGEGEKLAGAEIEASEPRVAPPAGSVHVDRVLIVLRGHEGEELARASASTAQFFAQCGHGPVPLPELRAAGAPAILGEEARLAYRGKTLECLIHGSHGEPTVRRIYDLDGYGRIKGARDEEP